MPAPDTKSKPKADKVENKPTVENKPAEETRGRSRILMISICAALVVVLGTAAFFAAPYLKTKFKSSGPVREEVKATLALEPFLVNLADKEEVRFVKTTFQLGLAQEPSEEAKNSVVIASIRDSIISLLSSKTSEQILTPEGKDKLREEIRSRIRPIAPRMKVLEVYIVDFVVQL
jgi:flagellar protein FliL